MAPHLPAVTIVAGLLLVAASLAAAPPLWADPRPNPSTPGVGPASRSLSFGVYPGGQTGELRHAQPADPAVVLDRLVALRAASEARPFHVHVYTSWNVYDDTWLARELDRYQTAGIQMTLTLRFQPPAGQDGDIAGFEAFVRHVARTYGSHPALFRLVVGNEANVYDNPDASDGPYRGSHEAIVLGAAGAREELDAIGSPTEVGVNMAVIRRDFNAAYLHELLELGGPRFRSALAFVGVNVYPGLWPPTDSGDAYQDMVEQLALSRGALDDAGLGPPVSLDILENGYPTPDEDDQARRLAGFVGAVVDHAQTYGVSGYSWFSLWDADTDSDNPFGHYGLLRSDLSPKPAFTLYQSLLAATTAPAGG